MGYFNKIKRVILSRFKKEVEQDWIKERRLICFGCEYNTKNNKYVSLLQKSSTALSNFYSAITFAKVIDLGSCKICTCPLFFKTREEEEECDKGKWKSIVETMYTKKHKIY